MGRVCTDAKPAVAENRRPRPFFDGAPKVLNIAHRGASASAPEHTTLAYELALQQGADVLELDLRTTRDGVLVVAHDATLQRTHGLDVRLNQQSFAELVRLTGERSPSRLEDVLARFDSARFNLELKDEDVAAARALARLLEASGAGQRVLVASAHDRVLREFRRASGGAVATSASTREALRYRFCELMGRSCPTPFVALQLPALRWLGLTHPEFIQSARERGLSVHFWTIDDESEQRALIASGADGIMTNYPLRLANVLGAGGKASDPR